MSTIYRECIMDRDRARAEVTTTTCTFYLMDMTAHDARNALEHNVMMVEDPDEQLTYINTANIVSIRILN